MAVLGGPASIKGNLRERPEIFTRCLLTRCLLTKLLEYGAGRELSVGDKRAVDVNVQAEPSGGFFKYYAAVEPMEMMAPRRIDLSRSGQLYNPSNAPYEPQNLYADHPDIVKKLQTEMLKAINTGRCIW